LAENKGEADTLEPEPIFVSEGRAEEVVWKNLKAVAAI